MRTVFLIITLLLGLIASAQVKLYHSTVNTYESFSKERESVNEFNDCSVRALASIFDLDYSTALELTYDNNREFRTGMDAKTLVKLTIRMTDKAHHFKVDKFNSRQFAKYLAMPNYDFLVISRHHVHVLKYDSDKDMLVAYGNPLDTNLKIIYAVAIKR